ncbi:MAG: hypothetical protein WC974_01265 [Thermoplasmata archaeon]
MKKQVKIGLIIGLILATGIIGAVIGATYNTHLDRDRGIFYQNNTTAPPPGAPPGAFPQREGPGLFEQFNALKIAVTTINAVICIILIAQYAGIYRKVKSNFTIGLIIITFALLTYALTSNPLLPMVFGYRGYGMGPFLMIPDIFATLALIVLLYISME